MYVFNKLVVHKGKLTVVHEVSEFRGRRQLFLDLLILGALRQENNEKLFFSYLYVGVFRWSFVVNNSR